MAKSLNQRTLGVVTVGRSDYGLYLPILRRVQDDPELRLYVIVAGMHLSPEFGGTVKMIEEDGFTIGDRIEMLLSSDTPEAIGKSMGLGLIGFAQAYARFRPDILLVLGDRFEMHAAALAALPFKIPVAHIHGGEITEGAIDDALRHSITKLSHLHFVAMDEYARRVVQLGEEPWRVIVSGAPSLDNLKSLRLLSACELENHFGFSLAKPPLLVTFHPVTLEHEQTEWQVKELLSAVDRSGLPIIFTLPNADTSNYTARRLIEDFVKERASSYLVSNLGLQAYFSVMSVAAAMVGNSSSGIIEAPSFQLPVVNVGSRQKGRIRADNVVDVGYGSDEILLGLHRALDPSFRLRLRSLKNPYGNGCASETIVQALKKIPMDSSLITKRFVDVPGAVSTR